MRSKYRPMHRHSRYATLAVLLAASQLGASPVVTAERGSGADWKFPTVPRPSRSDIARDSKITVAGAQKEMSCLSPDGMHNGVLPWTGRLKRDFFAFSNFDPADGKIVMDLGKVQPVAAVATYSWQDAHGGFVNGMRAPQVYTLYGSAAENANPADLSAWTKIAEVDTRPQEFGGQHGSFIRDEKGALLGNFRWVAWAVKHTLKPGQNPDYTNTWFTELDVHTPETLKHAGDAVMAGAELEETVLSFKTHFDIGFTHAAPDIVNIYRTSMIDHALGLIDESRKLPQDQRFAWTIPSWVMWQILWPGQNPARKERVLQAVKEGDLVVHALPVTLQTESLDLEDLVAGLAVHTKIAREFGIPLSRAGKMTDVPSHSWILPTLLRNAGIDFFHIGTNSCNERPDVPLLYHWEGPDGSRILTFHNQGYGSDNEQGKGLYPPKDWPYKHWLAMINSSDNEGPPSQAKVLGLLAEAKRNLPNVRIRLGKMEDFSDAIAAEEKAGAKVPVIRADMPDSWIHGMGSMPAMEELAHKTRPELIAAGSLDTHLNSWGLPRPDIRQQLFTAYERSMMYGEHTWGGAKNLEGRNAYTDKNFAQTIKTDAICLYLQKTWNDHADYMKKSAAITDKLVESEMSQLAAAVNVAGDRMVVFNPLPYPRDALVEIPGKPGSRVLVKNLPPSGYKTVALSDKSDSSDKSDTSDTATLENAFLKVTLDRTKGGIVSIVDKKTGREMVDSKAKYAFGQYLYQRFDRKQTLDYDNRCEHLDGVYGLCTGWNIRADIPADVPYAEAVPTYQKMDIRRNGTTQTAELSAAAAGIIASKVTTTITLPENSPWLEIAIRLDDKQPDYWPENGGFYLPVNAANPQFRIGRLGGVADPAKDFARGSNRTYGYVNHGAMIAGADGKGVGICPLDHGIMSFGEKGIYTLDPDYVPNTPLACVSMFNNLWTINFPYWISGTVQSRVRVWATNDLTPASLVEPALDARHPVLAAVASGPAGKLPATAGGLAFSRPGIRLTYFGRNRDGEGTVLRMWEQAGVTGAITITIPGNFTTATPVNLRGEKSGEPIRIDGGRLTTCRLKAYAPVSFLLTPELPSAATPPGKRETTLLANQSLTGITQGWSAAQKDKSVGGLPIKVGGVDFKSGIGTHAPMTWILPLEGNGIEFGALVGMQDFGPADKGKGSVEFIVIGDGKELFRSGVMRSGDPAKPVKLSLKGIQSLILQFTDGGDGTSADHAVIINPELTHTGLSLDP